MKITNILLFSLVVLFSATAFAANLPIIEVTNITSCALNGLNPLPDPVQPIPVNFFTGINGHEYGGTIKFSKTAFVPEVIYNGVIPIQPALIIGPTTNRNISPTIATGIPDKSHIYIVRQFYSDGGVTCKTPDSLCLGIAWQDPCAK